MNKLTVRLTRAQIDWLRKMSRLTGLSIAQLVRNQLESAKSRRGEMTILRLAGAVKGLVRGHSSGKGFSH